MGLLGRILLMVASAVGVLCCLAAIVEYRAVFEATNAPDYVKAAVSCLFIEMFILSGMLIFLFITLCCPCNDIIMGIVIAVGGGAAAVFAVIAYSLIHKPAIDLGVALPTVSEWTFAGIFNGAAVLLIALTMAVS